MKKWLSVVLVDDSALEDFRVETYATALSALVSDATPGLLLFPTTSRGRELAGMLAIDLNTGVLVDVVAMELDGDKVVATRPIYAGKLLQKTICNGTPQIITVRGNSRNMMNSYSPTSYDSQSIFLHSIHP